MGQLVPLAGTRECPNHVRAPPRRSKPGCHRPVPQFGISTATCLPDEAQDGLLDAGARGGNGLSVGGWASAHMAGLENR